MERKKNAVIGGGNIGLRHIQALFLTSDPIELYVVDPNPKALERIKAAYDEYENKDMVCIHLLENMGALPKEIDLALVATASGIRRKVTEELLQGCEVKNLILEKILFQRLEDYEKIGALLRKKKIPTWVNCARRMYQIYRQLQEELKDAEDMQIVVSGGQAWELACNAIHMIDLVGYLAGCADGSITLDGLEKEIYQSKRAGYLEIGGVIKGRMGRCSAFSITTNRQQALPLTVMINSDELKCIINENTHKIAIARKENNWIFEEEEGDFPFQSRLTQIAVWDILKTGACRLPDYETARYEHELLQKPLTEYFEKQGVDKGLCPIT